MTSTRRAGLSALPEEPSSQIVIQAKPERLPDLQRWVERLTTESLLPAVLVHRIDICLTELVTNVISYGYPDGRTGAVRIRLWRQPEQIEIRIDDDGTPFDPTAFEPPELPSSLSDAPSGGRGIRLVRHFCDELHHSAGAAGNQLTLVFRGAGTGTPALAPAGDHDPATLKPT
jgi:anti-sigma regulatory factor (Ser/Thr protein kinase)